MTTHDAVTRLLDARRLQGLLTNQAGRVIAQYSFLDSAGSSSITHLADISGEQARRITRGDQSVGPAALSENGTIVFASARKGEDGKDADSPSLWALPDNGEARKLADHDGGFSRLEIKGETLIVEFPVHTWAADENDHQDLQHRTQRGEGQRHPAHGIPRPPLGPRPGSGQQTLAVAKLDEAKCRLPRGRRRTQPPGRPRLPLSVPAERAARRLGRRRRRTVRPRRAGEADPRPARSQRDLARRPRRGSRTAPADETGR
jgi:hypothetical protein